MPFAGEPSEGFTSETYRWLSTEFKRGTPRAPDPSTGEMCARDRHHARATPDYRSAVNSEVLCREPGISTEEGWSV